MSFGGQQAGRVIHVPTGAGPAWWVYGDKDTMKVRSTETDGLLTVVETIVPPHGGTPPHIHENENEAFYILDGKMEALDVDKRFQVETGSFVFFPKGGLHQFTNLLDTPTKILLLFFPAGFEGYLQEVGTSVVEGEGPPEGGTDLDEASRVGAKYGLRIVRDEPTA